MKKEENKCNVCEKSLEKCFFPTIPYLGKKFEIICCNGECPSSQTSLKKILNKYKGREMYGTFYRGLNHRGIDCYLLYKFGDIYVFDDNFLCSGNNYKEDKRDVKCGAKIVRMYWDNEGSWNMSPLLWTLLGKTKKHLIKKLKNLEINQGEYERYLSENNS